MKFCMWKTKTTFLLCLCLFCFSYVLFILSSITRDNENDEGIDINTVKWTKYVTYGEPEDALKDVTLKIRNNEVAVAIVDQHQEVVPYWFKAVDEGIISRTGNILIHIDGHSDMAVPDNYTLLKKFRYSRNMLEKNYLPLMQSNDVFIISAILHGLIDRVIWIQPDWNNDSRYTRIKDSYIGVIESTNKLCECFRRVYMKKKLNKERQRSYKCLTFDRETGYATSIPVRSCKSIRKFKFVEVSESKFIKTFNFRASKNIIVDIDQDFYGVESGVQALVNRGISLKTIELVDYILSKLYCVNHTNDEQRLNEKMKLLFGAVFTTRKRGLYGESLEKGIERLMLGTTGNFICDHTFIRPFTLFLIITGEEEIATLSKANYCLFDSIRLRSIKLINETGFYLCHGTIFPDDELNKIYVGTTTEIDKRTKNLGQMLSHISSFTKPGLYTICRSLRDGYTPREQQVYIEEKILSSIHEVTESNGQVENVIYDKYLSFGKQGWVS